LDGIIGGGIDLEEALFAVPVVVFGEIDPGWGGFEGDIGVETAVDEGVVADDEAGGGEGAEGVDGGIFAGGEVEGGIEESGMFFGEEMGIDARGVDAGEGGGAIGGEGEGACGADFWGEAVAGFEPVIVGGWIAEIGVESGIFAGLLVEFAMGLEGGGEGGELGLEVWRREIAEFCPSGEGMMIGEFRERGFFEEGDGGIEFGEPEGGELGADGGLEFFEGGAVEILAIWGIDIADGGSAADHHAVEFVIILLADGVEFMVMAAGAGDGEAEEGFGDDVDLVIGEGDLFGVGVDDAEAVGDEAELGGGDGGFVEFEGGVEAGVGEEIAREVFADQGIGGEIFVEGADEVIAVTGDVGDFGIAFAAVGFGVAEPIHPVARPAFAVARGGEELIDEGGVGGVGGGGEESGEGLGGGREAGEDEVEASDEGSGIGEWGGGEVMGLEGGVEEAIDGVGVPGGIGGWGRGGGDDGLEGPPEGALVADGGPI
jgi:hypothetical protein